MKIYDVSLTFTVVREDPEPYQANTPEKVVQYMAGAFDSHPEQESFWVIILNRKNFAKGRVMISLGTATSTLAHPREIFRAVILASGTGFICVHNHPSGDPSPSAADTQLTRTIREAARVMDIEFLDHVIIGSPECDPAKKGFYSFRTSGIL